MFVSRFIETGEADARQLCPAAKIVVNLTCSSSVGHSSPYLLDFKLEPPLDFVCFLVVKFCEFLCDGPLQLIWADDLRVLQNQLLHALPILVNLLQRQSTLDLCS